MREDNFYRFVEGEWVEGGDQDFFPTIYYPEMSLTSFRSGWFLELNSNRPSETIQIKMWDLSVATPEEAYFEAENRTYSKAQSFIRRWMQQVVDGRVPFPTPIHASEASSNLHKFALFGGVYPTMYGGQFAIETVFESAVTLHEAWNTSMHHVSIVEEFIRQHYGDI